MLTLKCSSNNGDDFSQKLINTANRILELRGRPKIGNETFFKNCIIFFYIIFICVGGLGCIQSWYSHKSSSGSGLIQKEDKTEISSKNHDLPLLGEITFLVLFLGGGLILFMSIYSLWSPTLRTFFFIGLISTMVFFGFWMLVESLLSSLGILDKKIFSTFLFWSMWIFFLTISPLILYFFINTSFIKYILTHLGLVLLFSWLLLSLVGIVIGIRSKGAPRDDHPN